MVIQLDARGRSILAGTNSPHRRIRIGGFPAASSLGESPWDRTIWELLGESTQQQFSRNIEFPTQCKELQDRHHTLALLKPSDCRLTCSKPRGEFPLSKARSLPCFNEHAHQGLVGGRSHPRAWPLNRHGRSPLQVLPLIAPFVYEPY